ncbi:MAG: hypothetical protein ACO3A8_10995, partial [Steroidobacteraceae bacterium]
MQVTKILMVLTASLTLCAAASAGPVTLPKAFTPGSPIKADEMNGNFKAVADSVNGSAKDIDDLKASVKTLSTTAGTPGPAGPA